MRASTPPFLDAFVAGLRQSGADVLHLGLLPTPMVYFAKRHLHAPGSAIVTASHNPASVNGLKWMLGDRPPGPEDVRALARDVAHPPSSETTNPEGLRSFDPSPDYQAWLKETFATSSDARFRIVLDPMFGCWAGRALPYLKGIFPRCEFLAVRDTPDPQFRGITPDPSHAKNLSELCETVRREKGDLGLAFDGDGDRVGFVDRDGVVLTAEQAVWVLLHTFGPQLSRSKFVYDLKFSDHLPETARSLGAEPLVERSGHAFIRKRMCDTGSVFGAEISGHYFFQALAGGDDALYAACHLIAFLAGRNASLAELRAQCPPVHISSDLRVPVAAELQSAIVARIRATWGRYPQRTIDGVRIDTPEGWILVRPSVTEAALTFRFEGRDHESLENLVHRFCSSSPDFGEELRAKFMQAR